MRTALIIPTRNSGAYLERLLPALDRQTLQPDELLVVDSASTDGSPERWLQFGARVVSIDANHFNHGGTRRWASTLVKADCLIYMTQDAVPWHKNSLRRLRAGLYAAPDIGVAYGRQLPHPGSSVLAALARNFNYPPQSRVKRWSDATQLGIKTCFSSNAFAAYRHDALLVSGGFPTDAIGSEDAYVAARMLLAGYAVHYAADALVCHSHDYTPAEEFRRYFDIGVFYSRERWIGQSFGTASGEGLRFVKQELHALWRSGQAWRAPTALYRNVLKLLGYWLGRRERHLPAALKQRISMFPNYWMRQNP
ncbi:glycosyltransferase family 2 protein [Dyella flagellata]|uniref:Biofilm formation protein PslC n=1 Tax=Dyella flagellata TaxID=1867833 RepID=A0ABQ5XFM0_9GAMM|nr:glycosyltransferase family A protein [Dyella flagellata]GLQ89451.1 biofilm formation protein PslC [Dyella flagellata]